MGGRASVAKSAMPRGEEPEPRLSRASVGRLSLYLRRLEALLREGATKVSSGALGKRWA